MEELKSFKDMAAINECPMDGIENGHKDGDVWTKQDLVELLEDLNDNDFEEAIDFVLEMLEDYED